MVPFKCQNEVTFTHPLSLWFIESIMAWTKPILFLFFKYGTCRLVQWKNDNYEWWINKVNYVIQLVKYKYTSTSHVIPRSKVKVKSTVDAPDISSTWTVCLEIISLKWNKKVNLTSRKLRFWASLWMSSYIIHILDCP